jgi:hypothetical protein
MRVAISLAVLMMVLAVPVAAGDGTSAPPSPRSYGLAWHEGYWQRGMNGGHFGWWWVVGGYGYLYQTMVRPYPDPYIDPVMVLPVANLKPS